MSKVHELKCWPMFYRAVKNGDKLFEIRNNDRDFNVNDIIQLREFHEKQGYTGDSIHRKITYIANFPEGLRDGYICMGIGPVDNALTLQELIAEIERRRRSYRAIASQPSSHKWGIREEELVSLMNWIEDQNPPTPELVAQVIKERQ